MVLITSFFRYASIMIVLIIFSPMFAQKTVVLEMFTSQGCSSCPPADKVIEEVEEKYPELNIIPISYHVDYWNRLGWKDPFSQAKFSTYQRQYASQWRERSVYTPQLVLNGEKHIVGSNTDALSSYLHLSETEVAQDIQLKAQAVPGKINVDYTFEGQGENITLVVIAKEKTTEILRGENRGRKLNNSHIAAVKQTFTQKTQTVTLYLPKWVESDDTLEIVAYTQDEDLKILSAVRQGI